MSRWDISAMRLAEISHTSLGQPANVPAATRDEVISSAGALPLPGWNDAADVRSAVLVGQPPVLTSFPGLVIPYMRDSSMDPVTSPASDLRGPRVRRRR
jgi:hypothetical protein